MVYGVHERGTDHIICKSISPMLCSRRIQVSIFNKLFEIASTIGCQQGGVLSQLLWNLEVYGLLDDLTQVIIYGQGYADDIVLVVQSKYYNIVDNRLNAGLQCVS